MRPLLPCMLALLSARFVALVPRHAVSPHTLAGVVVSAAPPAHWTGSSGNRSASAGESLPVHRYVRQGRRRSEVAALTTATAALCLAISAALLLAAAHRPVPA